MVHNLAGRKKIYISFSTNFFSRPPRVDTLGIEIEQAGTVAGKLPHFPPDNMRLSRAAAGRLAAQRQRARVVCRPTREEGGSERARSHRRAQREATPQRRASHAFHPLSHDKSWWGSMMQYNLVHSREAFERRKITHMLHASLPAYPERPSLGGTFCGTVRSFPSGKLRCLRLKANFQ